MNKVILGLILAVCILGLALVMLNERLGRNSDNQPVPVIAEHRRPVTPTLEDVRPLEGQAEKPALPARPERTPAEILSAAKELEEKAAEDALSPPVDEKIVPVAEASARIPEKTPEPAPVLKPEPEPVAERAPLPEQRKPEPKPEPARKPEQPPVQKQETQQPKPVEQPKPAKAEGKKTITRFVVFSREKGATIRVAGNGPLNYKSMILENPDRVVLDLDGDWQFPATPGVPKNDFVNSLRVGKNGDKTRVVIDLKEKPRLSRVLPAKNGESVDVRLDK